MMVKVTSVRISNQGELEDGKRRGGGVVVSARVAEKRLAGAWEEMAKDGGRS